MTQHPPAPEDRTPTPVRVVLVDDDPLVRSALTLMLGGSPDVQIVGDAADGSQALAVCERTTPDVVLMDIRMPVMHGLDATRELMTRPHPPRVVILTTFAEDEYVVAAVAAGADGFLLKDTPPATIVAAIRSVAEGDAMLSPSAARTLIGRLRDSAGGATGPQGGADAADDPDEVRRRRALALVERLTEREREVALALAEGLSNAEIGARLYLSVPTVKAHVSHLMDKLGAGNRVQVAITVHRAGLV